ncbi:MAG TPA: TIR domain-containing protein [Pyrinomonadaceae bacterium]|nr:TIR domain-containing protein [Pyrinomonadaceae bacterium]
MSEQTPQLPTVEPPPDRFDVFLSYNSLERSAVKRIAEKLKREQLEPWFDRWNLVSGGDWQNGIPEGLRASAACAVFVGPSGIGNWEGLEYKLATDRMAKDREFRLFLVLLPGLPEAFDANALPPFLSIRTWVDLRPGIEDTRAFQSLINAIKGLPLGPERPTEQRDDVCPYRGLQTFDEEHAEFFFGRDADIQRVIEKLKQTRFLAVVGPSGSGKSSLVRAGLLPALKRGVLPDSDTWRFRVFTPTAHPLTQLAANLLRLYPQEAMHKTLDQMSADERTLHLALSLSLAEAAATERVVWVVDQFEEVFTLCQDQREREQFINNLLYAASVPDGRCVILLTLRADFYHKCAAYPELSARIAAQQFLVSLMGADNLRQAIEEPAWHVGLEFEPGLVSTILNDVESQPGALPLLEHALLELWERRRGRVLSLEAYRESGGVEGAIAKRADTIYEGFDAEQQKIARRIMLRLTQPGEGTEDTRRRATMLELITKTSEGGEVEGVAQALADSRLLTTGSDEEPGHQTIEVSHEALIRGWPRLRKWIEEDRAGLRILRRLTDAAREWQPTKDEGLLYRGVRLAQAVEWRERNEDALNNIEREFLNASAAAEQAKERKRKRFIIGLIAGFIFAVGLALLALFQWWRANDQAELALARQLAAESYAQMENQPDLGLLLGVEANRVRTKSFVARRSLLLDMYYREYLSMYLHGHTAAVDKVLFSPDGKLLASASGDEGKLLTSATEEKGKDNSVRLWDAVSGRPLGEALEGHQGNVNCLAFSPDGELLASGDAKGVIILWDVATRRMVSKFLTGERRSVWSLAFSPDKILAAGSSGDGTGEISLWNVATHERMGEPLQSHTTFVQSLAFSPDGKTLASANGRRASVGVDASIILWDVATRRPLGSPLIGHTDEIATLAFSPDGKVLASGSADETVRLWDVAARKPLKDFEGLEADFREPMKRHDSEVLDVQFTRDGKALISADTGNHVLVREVEFSTIGNDLALKSSNPVKYFASYSSRETNSIAFSPETFKWATGGCRKLGADGYCVEAELCIWDTAARLPISRAVSENPSDQVESVAFSPDGRVLASGGCDGSFNYCTGSEVYLWDTTTRLLLGQLKGAPDEVTSLAYSPDGTILAAGSCAKPEDNKCKQGEIRLWNTATRQLVSQPLTGHSDTVKMLIFSSDGKTLVSSEGQNIILWNIETRQRLGEIAPGHLYDSENSFSLPVNSIALSPDGKTLASGGCGKRGQRLTTVADTYDTCIEGEIRLWDVSTRRMIGQPLSGHKDKITSVAFSPDGKTLASASGQADGTIQLWDVGTRQPLGGAFTGSIAVMNKMVFSPDGETLVSASLGNALPSQNIFLWNVATRQLIGQPLLRLEDSVMDIALSPDGRWLASGGSDKALILWDMKLETWTEDACRTANRNLTPEEWEQYFPGKAYHKTCPNLP